MPKSTFQFNPQFNLQLPSSALPACLPHSTSPHSQKGCARPGRSWKHWEADFPGARGSGSLLAGEIQPVEQGLLVGARRLGDLPILELVALQKLTKWWAWVRTSESNFLARCRLTLNSLRNSCRLKGDLPGGLGNPQTPARARSKENSKRLSPGEMGRW